MRFVTIFFAVALNAFPAVVTSGYIDAHGVNNQGTFLLNGDGFSVFGHHSNGYFGGCDTCPVGSIVPANFSVSGGDVYVGWAIIGNKYYPNIIWGNASMHGSTRLAVTTDPVTLTGAGVFPGPFQFSGFACGLEPILDNPDCDISLPSLTGQGTFALTATARLSAMPDPGNPNPPYIITANNMVYTFGVPEPASAWTAGAGLGLLALASLGRRLSLRNSKSLPILK